MEVIIITKILPLWKSQLFFYELWSQFSFNVDEVSLEQAQQALRFELYGDEVEAPIDEVRCDVPFWNSITNDYSYAFLCTGYENFDSFEFQRDYLLRDFGRNGSEAPMSVSVRRTLNVIGSETDYRQEGDKWVENKTYDVCTYSYSVINSSGTEIMTGTSDSFLNTRSIYTYADKNITIHTETGDSLIRETEKSDTALKITLNDNDGYNVSLSLNYNNLRPYTSNPNANEFNTVPVTVLPAYEAMRCFYCETGTAGIATETNLTVKVNPPKKLLHIQAGANADQRIDIEWPALSNSILGIGGIKTDTFGSSQSTISIADEAISMVSDVRSTFGAYQNRLEHAQNVDQNTAENLQNAESRIRDADMAKEVMAHSQSQILNDAAMSMISQANQSTQGILKLLQ